MKRFLSTAHITLFALACTTATSVSAEDLDSFGVLAGSTVTNTGTTIINGNVGVSPGSAITGLGTIPSPGVVNGTLHSNDQVAIDAQTELETRFNELSRLQVTQNLTGQDLGGQTLTAGVYAFDTSAALTTLSGPLTLDGQGNPNAVFIFQIGSTLTTGSASSVQLINGAQGGNVFFVLGSSATLGTTSTFHGQILALAAITLTTGANINCGAAWAQTAAVTLDNNNITVCVLEEATVGEVIGRDATDNQEEVAEATDDFVAGGGVLPPGFQNLVDFLSPAELAEAFTQLSGEVATGVAPTGIQAMNSFLNLLLQPAFGNGRRSAPVPVPVPVEEAPHTVRVLGYDTAGAPAADATFTSLDQPRLALDPRRWEFWAAGYGGHSTTDGDTSVGSHDRTSSHLGFAVGADYSVTEDAEVGFAVGGGNADFDLSDRLGGGRSNMVQAAVYSRVNFDKVYVTAALAYAYHDVLTDRSVTVAGVDRYAADFAAHNVAGHIEAGYRVGWLTPYAALRVQTFRTPGYRESTESGASTFALSYDGHTTTTARTEIGARVEHTFALNQDANLSVRAGAAWAHDYWSETEIDASFQALPRSHFTIRGAEPATNSLLLSAGAEVSFVNGFAVGGSLDGQFADGSQSYAGTAELSYRW